MLVWYGGNCIISNPEFQHWTTRYVPCSSAVHFNFLLGEVMVQVC